MTSVAAGRRLLLLGVARTLRRLLHLRHGFNMRWFKNSFNRLAEVENLVFRRARALLNEQWERQSDIPVVEAEGVGYPIYL